MFVAFNTQPGSEILAFVLLEEIPVLSVYTLTFATARSTGEIDFMLQGDLDCVPIEVKAEQNLRARSLRAFYDKYKPGMAIRSSMSNYKQEDWLTNGPLYMLAEYLKRTIYVVS